MDRLNASFNEMTSSRLDMLKYSKSTKEKSGTVNKKGEKDKKEKMQIAQEIVDEHDVETRVLMAQFTDQIFPDNYDMPTSKPQLSRGKYAVKGIKTMPTRKTDPYPQSCCNLSPNPNPNTQSYSYPLSYFTLLFGLPLTQTLVT
jgi:hypothetical protein